MVTVHLSRKNLLDLLRKMDGVKQGIPSACAILKRDMEHPTLPQSHPVIFVHGVEDEDYYIDRKAGMTREDLIFQAGRDSMRNEVVEEINTLNKGET